MRRSPTRFAAALCLLAVLTITVGCSGGGTEEAEDDIPAIAATIAIVDGAFEPRETIVDLGGSVLWRNDDVSVHRVVFLAPDGVDAAGAAPKDPPTIDSGNIEPGRAWFHTFTAEGEYFFYDMYRNTMKGSVVVRLAP